MYDFGDRLALNFGHTLGHAIEQYYHYEKYSHGEAISIGMVQLTRIAEAKGLTQVGTADQICDVLKVYQLPDVSHLKTADLKQAMAVDKKNINKKLSYVLLHKIGHSYIYPSDLSFIDEVEEV